MKLMGAGLALGAVLGANVALAQDDINPGITISDEPKAPTILMGPSDAIDVYVLEQNYFQATGQNTQRRGFFDHEADIACEYTITGFNKIGITSEPTELHGVTMPEGSRYTNTFDVTSSLACEKTETVPVSWSGGNDISNPVEELTDTFQDSVSHTFGNSAVLFIQRNANDTSRTIYSRDIIEGTGEYVVSIAEMLSPSSTKVDFMFVNGQLLEAEENEFVPIADVTSYSFE